MARIGRTLTCHERHLPADFTAATRALRQGGSYLRYHPDLLAAASNDLVPEVLEHVADVSTALARLGARLRANPLPVLYSTALRSESISSSWIEECAPIHVTSPRPIHRF